MAKARPETREKVLEALLAGLPPKIISHLFNVNKGVISWWKNQFLEEVLVRKNLKDPNQLDLF